MVAFGWWLVVFLLVLAVFSIFVEGVEAGMMVLLRIMMHRKQ